MIEKSNENQNEREPKQITQIQLNELINDGLKFEAKDSSGQADNSVLENKIIQPANPPFKK